MTKTVSIKETSIQIIIALTRNGDEVVIEENGEPLAKVLLIEKFEPKQRILGLREGQVWMSDDFDDELPDSFWLGEDE